MLCDQLSKESHERAPAAGALAAGRAAGALCASVSPDQVALLPLGTLEVGIFVVWVMEQRALVLGAREVALHKIDTSGPMRLRGRSPVMAE
jgi:hypothetical protein